MAVFGTAQFDVGTADANTLTTTAQYCPVYMSGVMAYSVHNTTNSTWVAGVCATEMDSNSTQIGVARAGKFKVLVGMSVTAGQYLYAGGNTIGAYARDAAIAATTTAAGNFAQALENGSTGTVISCWLFGGPTA